MANRDDARPPGRGNADDKTPVTRVLTVGAKGAERVARATGVDRALNQAAEEAIVRALRSRAVMRALARAIESQGWPRGWLRRASTWRCCSPHTR
jgi:hypothetical protein